MALDRVNHRIFIPAYGNGGFRAFQLDDDGLPVDRAAMYVIGRESLYGRRSNPEVSERELGFPGAIAVFDNSTQRLFGIDRFNNRILVYRAAPHEITRFPSATVVIGQADFQSTERGTGPNRFGMAANAALDEERQRMWVADPPNNRVLMFDVHPERLDSNPDATMVLGQPDFASRERGVGPNRFAGPSSVAYDPVFDRLFVSDSANNRVLVFDAKPGTMTSNDAAIAVMGQPDFESRVPRKGLDELKPEALAYDHVHHRLLISEDLQHRIMVYDAHPDRIGGPAKAMAVVGQPDMFSTLPEVSQSRLAMPRLAVDPVSQKLYVSEGFPAGNRVSIWDIDPDHLAPGMLASDVLGHETASGDPDFDNRMAQGHLHGRALAAARAVALDPVDHRLFVADEYNHRVIVWQLDTLNRVGDRSARWVLGQPDLRTSLMGAPSARNMTVPLAVAYDTSTRRLYVGDGYRNRVLVYDAAPGGLRSGMAASIVLGQRDFESVEFGSGAAGLNFGVRMGRGIASNFIPMGIAVDEKRQRLFVSDGENNRVLVYDAASLANGAPAHTVIGQPNFASTAPGSGAAGLHDPGHLAYDPEHDRLFVVDAKNLRVLVFDADPARLSNGAPASHVLGYARFDAAAPGGGPPGAMPGGIGQARAVTGAAFFAPNGLAHDAAGQLLYVSDAVVPADRVLAFDVAPERLRSGAAAVAALGASDAAPRDQQVFGGAKSYPGQFTLRDARGIAVDPSNGRLFVTGSFASRVVVYHFPRAAWRYQIAGHGLQYFHTPDALDLGARADAVSVRAARIAAAGSTPAATAVYSVTEMFADERTERHSRMLVSEAAVAASAPVTAASLFVEAAEARQHHLYLRNGGETDSRVTFRLFDRQGGEVASFARTVPAGRQVSLTVEAAAGRLPAGETMLAFEASQPITIAALRETTNARGQRVLAPAPIVTAPRGARQVLPLVLNGGGRRSTIVLLNDADEPRTGTVAFFDRFGARLALGTDSELMSYVIPPRAARVIATDGVGARVESGYVVVTAAGRQMAPYAAALVTIREGEVRTSESLVAPSWTAGDRFAVNTVPTLIRHGAIDTEIVVANAGDLAARVEIALEGAARAAVTVPAGQQVVRRVSDLFGDEVTGVVSVEADRPVGLAARQITTTLRGEVVAVSLPPLGDSAGAADFPYVPNGGGLSTEIRLANLSTVEAKGAIEFIRADGTRAADTILR